MTLFNVNLFDQACCIPTLPNWRDEVPIFQTAKGLVFYAHTPKCGGMSIEKSLSDFPTHLETPFLHGDNQQRFPCSPQHFHSEIILKLFDVNSFYYSFTVTRHPFKRLVSEYKFRSDIAKRQNRAIDDFNSWVERTFSCYDTNNFILDNHIRPQNEFLIPEMDVLRLEDGMESVFTRVSRMIDVNKIHCAAHVNKSTGLKISVGSGARELIRIFYKTTFCH